MLCWFGTGRILDPVMIRRTSNTNRLYILTMGASKIAILLNVAFSQGPHSETAQRVGSFMQASYLERSCVQFKKWGMSDGPSYFGVI